MTTRRRVLVAPSFFERLDDLLPDERTPTGGPSTTDFLLHEIPSIIDRLADNYEDATLAIDGVADVRVLVAAGALVGYIAVYAVLAADDAVEVIYLEIDDDAR